MLEFLRRRWPGREPVPLVLYSKPDCHLCEIMKQELVRAGGRRRYTLRVVNIEGDPALEEAHGRSIPVMTIGGRTAFKGRMSAEDFGRKFDRLAREWRATRREEP